MKKKILKFAIKNHCYARYGGNTKTMHIVSLFDKAGFNHSSHVQELIISEFGMGLPFKLSF